jgi:hypothetical protein
LIEQAILRHEQAARSAVPKPYEKSLPHNKAV